MDEPCSECGGRTIEFRGSGLDTQYKICSRYQEPGHKSEDQVRDEIRSAIGAHAPRSGRYG